MKKYLLILIPVFLIGCGDSERPVTLFSFNFPKITEIKDVISRNGFDVGKLYGLFVSSSSATGNITSTFRVGSETKPLFQWKDCSVFAKDESQIKITKRTFSKGELIEELIKEPIEIKVVKPDYNMTNILIAGLYGLICGGGFIGLAIWLIKRRLKKKKEIK